MSTEASDNRKITGGSLAAIGETVREAMEEAFDDSPSMSREVMRVVAEQVFRDKIPGHVQDCPLGKKLDRTNTRVLLATGAVLLVAALIPIFGVVLGSSLSGRAAQLDAMRTQLVTVQLQMARIAAIQENNK